MTGRRTFSKQWDIYAPDALGKTRCTEAYQKTEADGGMHFCLFNMG